MSLCGWARAFSLLGGSGLRSGSPRVACEGAQPECSRDASARLVIVLALAAVNVLGAVVFAGLYAASGSVRLPPTVLLAGLPLVFAGMTWLWVRVEDRSRRLDALRRVGRGAIALLAVVIGLPVAVLMPLFWLESQLPDEAVAALQIGPVMALLLIAIALVIAVNAIGGLAALAIAVGRRWHGRRSS